MEAWGFAIIFLAWGIGGFVNGVSGLGAGVIAMPFMLCVVDMRAASLAACLISLPLPAVVGWQHRRYLCPRLLRPLLAGMLPGMLAGMALLSVIPGRLLQTCLGIMLVAHMIWQLVPHPHTPPARPVLWGIMAGGLAGFVQALSGIGGPPAAMYAQRAHWDKDMIRANLSLLFVIISCPIIILQYRLGCYTADVMHTFLPAALGCGTGLVFAYPVARRIGEVSFQHLLAVVIGLSGLSMLIRAVWQTS